MNTVTSFTGCQGREYHKCTITLTPLSVILFIYILQSNVIHRSLVLFRPLLLFLATPTPTTFVINVKIIETIPSTITLFISFTLSLGISIYLLLFVRFRGSILERTYTSSSSSLRSLLSYRTCSVFPILFSRLLTTLRCSASRTFETFQKTRLASPLSDLLILVHS